MKTHTLPRRGLLAALLTTAVLATTASTHASLITWGAPTNISGDSDVSTAGTLVGAINGALSSASAIVTVNGVDFARLSAVTPSVGIFTVGITNGTDAPSAAAPFSSLSAPYQALLRDNVFNSAGAYTLTMSGLTVGETYAFQWWSNRSGSASTETTTAAAGTTVTLDANVGDVDGGLGQHVLGTFVADATSQAVQFTGRLTAAQLRQVAPAAAVPEPGSALAGLALVGLCGMMRRRR